MCLAQFYLINLSEAGLIKHNYQLETYIVNNAQIMSFQTWKGMDACWKMVYNKKDGLHRGLQAFEESVTFTTFYSYHWKSILWFMNIIKKQLHNKMGDEWNDIFVTCFEKDVFDGISNEAIIQRFQEMKPYRYLL